MALLGAQLDDLDNLSTRLTGTAADVETARTGAISLTNDVVADVTAAADRAHTRIGVEMSNLERSVADAAATADATQWTGSNAEEFRGAAQEFRSAIARSEAATNEAFESFRASVESMSTALDEYVTSLSGSLADAGAAAEAMARAVTDQRTNLDSVMNTGLSYR